MNYGNIIRYGNAIRQINYRTEIKVPEAKKDLGSMGWKIILTICLMKDLLLDPVKFICLTGVQVVPVVGQALGAVVAILVFFAGMLVVGTIMLYWRFNEVSVLFPNCKRKLIKKMIIKGLSLSGLFLDFIPFISILPWTSIYFYLNVKMENHERAEDRKEREETILAINRKFG